MSNSSESSLGNRDGKTPVVVPAPGPTRNLRILPKPTAATPIPPALQARLSAMMASRSAGASTSAPVPLLRQMAPRRAPPPRLSAMPGMGPGSIGPAASGLGLGRPTEDVNETPFSRLSNIVDPSGVLRFRNAVIDSNGVRFPDGQSFSISMTQLEICEDIGRGAFGAVKRIVHTPTSTVMAMKEIRLALEDAKLNSIIMELDVLHRAVAPEIVEFYGAFFVEGCVYYCMEYMDGGSVDIIQRAGPGVPEPVLARILLSVVRGLKFLKDELQIMHRDVKPSNILINKKGQVKLTDFGVSGQLEKSLARTHVGAQSYMAPERIDTGALEGSPGVGVGSTGAYTVAADVWSLGITALEMACGVFPYPSDPASGALAQLVLIVNGPPPELPAATFSHSAQHWVSRCLEKEPGRRATYAELLEHPFLKDTSLPQVDFATWVAEALTRLSATIGTNNSTS